MGVAWRQASQKRLEAHTGQVRYDGEYGKDRHRLCCRGRLEAASLHLKAYCLFRNFETAF